ncbi:hypothetical protein F511_46608 [Dorcoceras hygrometricum]|uniref:Uncharacterized protein n=1 Tax=Dorcoceras hygrometricum TaxID=472368 RepID=A0A2Z6ZT36_9LAMI|nr:hypothetical protein F511_46608 [Dorcoceras hygrometricum]
MRGQRAWFSRTHVRAARGRGSPHAAAAGGRSSKVFNSILKNLMIRYNSGNSYDQIRETMALIPLLGIRIRPPVRQRKNKNLENREAINTNNNSTCINIHRVFQACYLAGTCAWLQPVFQEPGASRLIAVVTSIRSTTRSETPSSDCTRSPDEISTIGFSTKN